MNVELKSGYYWVREPWEDTKSDWRIAEVVVNEGLFPDVNRHLYILESTTGYRIVKVSPNGKLLSVESDFTDEPRTVFLIGDKIEKPDAVWGEADGSY